MFFKHLSEEPFELDRSRTYDNKPIPLQTPMFSQKPKGLWLSVGDGWQRFSVVAEFLPDVFHTYEVEVDMEDILIIDGSNIEACPNWGEISKKYKGMAVLIYDWYDLRYEYMWYYMLDCASACIWDLTCIKGVKKIPNVEIIC